MFSLKWAAWLLTILIPMFLILTARAAQAQPDHVVIGYSACWLDELFPPQAYNYQALTHVARSFIRTTPEGELSIPDNFFNADLVRLSHAKGVKVLASIGGWVDSSENWFSMATYPQYEKRFFDELDKVITENHFDGVDIDWEPGAQTEPEKKAFTSFMRNLRARFPRWTLTTAVMVGEPYASHMDWKEISGYVDYVSLMTYDFAGVFSEYAYHHANLYSVPGSKAQDGISVDETVTRVRDHYGVASDKLLVGVPFYGKLFHVDHWNDPMPKEEPRVSGVSYTQALSMIKSGRYSEEWDAKAQAPYLQNRYGKGLVSYDDVRSMAIKCEYVKKHKLPGILIWVLGSDAVGDRTPLLDKIAQAFGSQANPVPAEALPQMESALVKGIQDGLAELKDLSHKLIEAGKSKEAKAVIPDHLPPMNLVGGKDHSRLVEHLKELQACFGEIHRLKEKAQQDLKPNPAS